MKTIDAFGEPFRCCVCDLMVEPVCESNGDTPPDKIGFSVLVPRSPRYQAKWRKRRGNPKQGPGNIMLAHAKCANEHNLEYFDMGGGR